MIRILKGRDNRIKISEDFDADHPMARAFRAFTPPDVSVGEDTRGRIKSQMLYAQRSRPIRRRSQKAARWRLALAIPATAALVVAVFLIVLTFTSEKKTAPVKYGATVQGQTGRMDVLGPGRQWNAVHNGDRLQEGCHLRTGPGSHGSVAFPDGSVARLSDDTEVRVRSIRSKSVVIEHMKGGTYHRVHKGSDYTVLSRGVSMKALGTAFNVENRVPEQLEIITLESAVEVEVGRHQPITVFQGEVMVVDTSGDTRAEKQPVSRERLEEPRLYTNASEDAREGNPTGIYQQLGVPLVQEPPEGPQQSQSATQDKQLTLELGGTVAETGVTLNWGISGDMKFETLSLLRSESAEPVFPKDEISSYQDLSMTSATDNSLLQEHTYQYRIAAVKDEKEIAYSNTVVLTVPRAKPKPETAEISLMASPSDEGVLLEWSVSGAARFDGFMVRRVVEKAPLDSNTPVKSSEVKRIDSKDVLCSYADKTVLAGHTYSYKVGLVVDGSVMAYSKSVLVEVPQKMELRPKVMYR